MKRIKQRFPDDQPRWQQRVGCEMATPGWLVQDGHGELSHSDLHIHIWLGGTQIYTPFCLPNLKWLRVQMPFSLCLWNGVWKTECVERHLWSTLMQSWRYITLLVYSLAFSESQGRTWKHSWQMHPLKNETKWEEDLFFCFFPSYH